MADTSVFKQQKAPYKESSLTLPPLMIGGAVFSYHYNEDVSPVYTEAILSRAISSGAYGTYSIHRFPLDCWLGKTVLTSWSL